MVSFAVVLALATALAAVVVGCVGDVKPEKALESTPTPKITAEVAENGEKLFMEKCSCHYNYFENPSKKPDWLDKWEEEYYGGDAEKWSSGIDIMVRNGFTSVSESEKKVIAEYLAERFSG